MKIIRLLIVMLILTALSTFVFLVLRDIIHLPWQPERSSYVYTELIKSSESSLLQTAEYRLKIVFPYDFVDEEDIVDWQYLQRQYDYLPHEYPMRASEDFYSDRVVPLKWKYADLYELCRKCGIDPAGRDEEFIVVSTRTMAGFSFNRESVKFNNPNTDENIVLTVPGPEITAIIIEDRDPEERGYPEIEMSPSQWSRFIAELTPEIGKLAVDEGILDLAEETAVFLLDDLFSGAGLKLQRIDFNYEISE